MAAAEFILSCEQGLLAIRTDATEECWDRTELINAYAETAKLGRPEINVVRIEAYQEGTVGWAVDTIIFRRPGKKQISMRHTFILHQERSEWKVIHAHYSYPAPDESTTLAGT